MAELESMRAEPPAGAVKHYFCEYYPAKGAKPEWHLPLTAMQKQAGARHRSDEEGFMKRVEIPNNLQSAR